jgi:sugar phosphate isomerase/epimerase
LTPLLTGIHIGDLALGVRRGAECARAFGLSTVQFDGVGEIHPRELARSGRREVVHLLARNGLELAALGVHSPQGLANAEENNRLVPAIAEQCALARDLGTRVVAVHVGRIADDSRDPARAAIAEALGDVLRAAEANGVVIAAEAGAESPKAIKEFLQGRGRESLRVCIDPGALATRGWSPVEAVRILGPHLSHAYLRDGASDRAEVPLGEGEVPWREYLIELAAGGYAGHQIVRTGTDRDRVDAARRALSFVARL